MGTSMPKNFMAGFTLAGYENPDGTVESCGSVSERMDGWPEEITIEGVTFTLESVDVVGKDSATGRDFINAEYV